MRPGVAGCALTDLFSVFFHSGDLFSEEDCLWMRNFCRSPGAPTLAGLCVCVCPSMVFMLFVRLMFLLRWLAWRAHAVWVLLSLLYFYGAHAFFSELEALLSPELSDTRVVEDVGSSKKEK